MPPHTSLHHRVLKSLTRFETTGVQCVQQLDNHNWQTDTCLFVLYQLPVSVDCSPLGHIVVAGAAGMLKVIQPDLKTEVVTLSGHTFDVSTCAFFPSGKVILSGGMDMSLRVWSVATGHCAAILLGHSGAVLGTAFIGRGRNVVCEWSPRPPPTKSTTHSHSALVAACVCCPTALSLWP